MKRIGAAAGLEPEPEPEAEEGYSHDRQPV